MGRRKLIGMIMAYPEAVYQKRVLDGLFAACEKYGYDVAVFTPMVQVCHFYQEYLKGELNIFELINFDKLDGVIVSSMSLTENRIFWVYDHICKKLKSECTKPVVSLGLPMADYEVMYTDDRQAFSEIAAHVFDAHGCKNVYFLSGTKGNEVSEQRIEGFTDFLKSRGLPVNENNIFYGDFWYTGGEALADRIISGEVPMPDAVICASDYIAMGLANRLIKHGISVPDQVIVTGYDAVAEAAINTPAITTYIPDVFTVLNDAVNYIRERIEPGAELTPVGSGVQYQYGLRLCSSCGCSDDVAHIKKCLNESLYKTNHNFSEKAISDTVDISRLIDSYANEILACSSDPEVCLRNIYYTDYLLRPYSDYYLCLTENWLDTDENIVHGYPEKMNCVIHTVPTENAAADRLDERYFSIEPDHLFDTSLMLPQLYEERDEPAVFYFVPVHFNENTFGYSVLKCSLKQEDKIGCVYRNWLRNVNNALEMVRARNRLMMFSERDVMTGLLNRRGMDVRIEKMLESAKPGDKCAVFVIDMDGLKYINDNFGHIEGDFGIIAIASAVNSSLKEGEISVRAGGDEFYIIGVGEYSDSEMKERADRFRGLIDESDRSSGKPYNISASIGWRCEDVNESFDIDNVIRLADLSMYRDKTDRCKQRGS